MGNLQKAFAYVMSDEDPKLEGKITKDNNGALVRFGFNARFNKSFVEAGFYEEGKIARDQALIMAHERFDRAYAAPVRASEILSDVICAKVCDLSFNVDPTDAVLITQQALNHTGPIHVVEDGDLGPATLNAINAADPARLVVALCEAQESFYRRSAAAHATVRPCLNGLIKRARKIPKFEAEQAEEAATAGM